MISLSAGLTVLRICEWPPRFSEKTIWKQGRFRCGGREIKPKESARISSSKLLIIAVLLVVVLVLTTSLMLTLPLSKIRVTLDNGTIYAEHHTGVMVFVIIDKHLGTWLQMEPGDAVSFVWHVCPGTHRVEVFGYYGANYSGLDGIQYINTFKVDILHTKNLVVVML